MSRSLPTSTIPYRQIRACYDDDTITVYQAYSNSIADAAIAVQRLDASPDFRSGARMTWIKPSWCWMMYRSGYASKDARQQRILAITMRRDGFDELLSRAIVAKGQEAKDNAPEPLPCQSTPQEPPVRVQWDPERTLTLDMLPYRSIQIGIPGALVPRWIDEWILRIEDVTLQAKELHRALQDAGGEVAQDLVPQETEYPVSQSLRARLAMDKSPPGKHTDIPS